MAKRLQARFKKKRHALLPHLCHMFLFCQGLVIFIKVKHFSKLPSFRLTIRLLHLSTTWSGRHTHTRYDCYPLLNADGDGMTHNGVNTQTNHEPASASLVNAKLTQAALSTLGDESVLVHCDLNKVMCTTLHSVVLALILCRPVLENAVLWPMSAMLRLISACLLV